MEVGKEKYMSFGLKYYELSTQKYCVIFFPYCNLLPIDMHHIRKILFRIINITKYHTPPLSIVYTYRVLLLLIIFVQ